MPGCRSIRQPSSWAASKSLALASPRSTTTFCTVTMPAPRTVGKTAAHIAGAERRASRRVHPAGSVRDREFRPSATVTLCRSMRRGPSFPSRTPRPARSSSARSSGLSRASGSGSRACPMRGSGRGCGSASWVWCAGAADWRTYAGVPTAGLDNAKHELRGGRRCSGAGQVVAATNTANRRRRRGRGR